MSTTEYRARVQETIREAFLGGLERYLELVHASQSVEDHRKAVELLAKVGDIMPEKEQRGTLPVVMINFGPGGTQLQVTQAAEVEEVPLAAPALEPQLNGPVFEVSDPAALSPSPLMKNALHVNLDVEPLLLERS